MPSARGDGVERSPTPHAPASHTASESSGGKAKCASHGPAMRAGPAVLATVLTELFSH